MWQTLAQADALGRAVALLLLAMSVASWVVIVWKGWLLHRAARSLPLATAAFWQAAEWVYAHTRGDGQGLPEGLRYPDLTPAAQQCLDSDRRDALIRAQSASAAQEGIKVTPTLRLQDRQSGKTLLLHGPVEGDALLSAIDLLAASAAAEPASKEMPTESLGDMPR